MEQRFVNMGVVGVDNGSSHMKGAMAASSIAVVSGAVAAMALMPDVLSGVVGDVAWFENDCLPNSLGTVVAAASGVFLSAISMIAHNERANASFADSPRLKVNGFAASTFAGLSMALALLSAQRECNAAADDKATGFKLMAVACVCNVVAAFAHALKPVISRSVGLPFHGFPAQAPPCFYSAPTAPKFYRAPTAARKFAAPAHVAQHRRMVTPSRVAPRMAASQGSGMGLAAAAVAAASLTSARPAQAAYEPDVQWTLSKFLDAVETDTVERVTFDETGKRLLAIDTEGARHQVEVLPSEGPEILKALRKHNVEFMVQPTATDPGIGALIANAFLPLAFLGGLFLLNRRNQGMGGMGGGGPMNPMNMLQNQSKIQIDPQTGVTFADVAGCDGSKLELTEVVDFLKFPEKYTKLGAKTPRGVLLEGPPGTGKTLLARACAGEAGVPFISTSGSEFVEMFVGVGASRIRNLFAEAKKNSPCIIFIDEIDAIGRQRSGGGGFATNDEREQTLNQILTEMDGFSGNTGVIVIAATNRGDILDNALLRPGRFDRRVPVDLPDKAGRVEILKVHCRDKPLAPEVQLDSIAGRTIGFSGASLQNLMNEAAIVTARRNKDTITFDEIDYAIDRITVGLEKSTGMSNQSRKRLVAYHEAGHALMASMLADYDYVSKVTIIPRSNGAGGFTLFTPSEDRMESGLYSLKYLKGQLAVALGGRIAEEVVFGADEVTTGASNDLQQVRNLARRMVAQWGFSKENLGATAWETPDAGQQMFGGPQTASQATESRIDEEVSKLVNEAYEKCYKTISENRPLLDAVVDALLEKETIDGSELFDLVAKFTGIEPKAVPVDGVAASVAASVMYTYNYDEEQ